MARARSRRWMGSAYRPAIGVHRHFAVYVEVALPQQAIELLRFCTVLDRQNSIPTRLGTDVYVKYADVLWTNP